ncbi:DUF4116 domain-containing protein [Legionella worsleiensis]|uniref:DUF4116 domain-containing protein n=1 Tax=Legionella worsleiensis TaxID=45076 RepID=A0A0W1AEK2_9GAMM|nr:DUF4116 domain-containing protein [Legionella worsleiensis]KTD79762.1 hypothetical protein Lwor_1276 [Legionella worsleiensis]STY32273.1 Uncharacterised protein [Legionella worsleiensis]
MIPEQSTKEEVLAAIKVEPVNYMNANILLQNDREVATALVMSDKWGLLCASEQAKKNKDVVLAAVKRNGCALKFADKSLQEDDEVVLAAVSQNGFALEFAGENQKDNDEIVLKAVQNKGGAIEFASRRLALCEDICLAAAKQDGLSLGLMFQLLRDNRKVVVAAVSQNSSAFQYASPTLRNDPEIARIGMKDPLFPMFYAGDAIKKNYELMLKAVKINGKNILFADPEIEKRRKLVLAAVQQNGEVIHYEQIKRQFGEDKEIVLAAIKSNAKNIRCVDYLLRDDRAFLLDAVNTNPEVIDHVSYHRIFLKNYLLFRNDALSYPFLDLKDLAIELVEKIAALFANRTIALEILNDILDKRIVLLYSNGTDSQKNDCMVLIQTLLGEPTPEVKSLGHMMLSLMRLEINRSTLVTYPGFFEFADDELKNNRDCVLEVVKNAGLQLKFAPPNLKADKKIALAAVKNNPAAMAHIDVSLAPFFESYLTFRAKQQELTGEVKEHAGNLLKQVETFFEQGKLDSADLIKVLDKTRAFMANKPSEQQTKDYTSFIQAALKSPSSAMQILGYLMMALAVAVAGVSIALGVTGVSMVPAVGTAALAVGLFATGAALALKSLKDEKENKELIQQFQLTS